MKKFGIIEVILVGSAWTFVLSLVMLAVTIYWAQK